jgi:hypothetical protein
MKLLRKLWSILKFWGKKKNQIFISFTMDKSNRASAEEVFRYVQNCRGRLEIHQKEYEFYVPVEQRDFMILKYPFLEEVKYVY